MISAYKIHFLVWTSLSWSTEFQWENIEIYYNINLGENSWILVYMKVLHVKRLCQSLTRFLISSVDKKKWTVSVRVSLTYLPLNSVISDKLKEFVGDSEFSELFHSLLLKHFHIETKSLQIYLVDLCSKSYG